MARSGLGPAWNCLFSNDFDEKKGITYKKNWGDGVLKVKDIKSLTRFDLPGLPDAVWASFPCQDLSLAGAGAGLRGDRSGTFWPFWKLMKSLNDDQRGPSLIVLENVCGTISSHEGKDFAAICEAFAGENYRVGAFVVDASLFVPQSRPRLFFVGVKAGVAIPAKITSAVPTVPWHTRSLISAYSKISHSAQQNWLWWDMPIPSPRVTKFSDLIENEPLGVSWHTASETEALLKMMNSVNLLKVEGAKKLGRKIAGTIYKRTRIENGVKHQRAEVRFDNIAGCLRTPAGGSSRQLIIVVEGKSVKSRLISPRETARLMGLPDSYSLPERYNEAYHLTGDGVVVPVVRHIAENILEQILDTPRTEALRESA